MESEGDKISTGKNEIWLDADGILHVRSLGEIEIDIEEAKKCFAVYEMLGCKNNTVLQLLDTGGKFKITSEARAYAAINGKDYFKACAILSNNYSVNMIVNFFNSFYKDQKVPFKLFDSEEKAIKWLKSL